MGTDAVVYEPSFMGRLRAIAPTRATGYALYEVDLGRGTRGCRYPASPNDCYRLDPEFFELPREAPPGVYCVQFWIRTKPVTQQRYQTIQWGSDYATPPPVAAVSQRAAPSHGRTAHGSRMPDPPPAVLNHPDYIRYQLEFEAHKFAAETRRLDDRDLRESFYTKEIGEAMAAVGHMSRQLVAMADSMSKQAERYAGRIELMNDRQIDQTFRLSAKQQEVVGQNIDTTTFLASHVAANTKILAAPPLPPVPGATAVAVIRSIAQLATPFVPLLTTLVRTASSAKRHEPHEASGAGSPSKPLAQRAEADGQAADPMHEAMADPGLAEAVAKIVADLGNPPSSTPTTGPKEPKPAQREP